MHYLSMTLMVNGAWGNRIGCNPSATAAVASLKVVTVTVVVTDFDVVVIVLTISSSLLIIAPGRNYYDFTSLYHFTCRFFRLVGALSMPTTTSDTICDKKRSSTIRCNDLFSILCGAVDAGRVNRYKYLSLEPFLFSPQWNEKSTGSKAQEMDAYVFSFR